MINQSHIVDPSNSKFVYDFPSALTLVEGDSCAIKKLNVFFSWFNISKKYGNNTMTYLWWDNAGVLSQSHTITFQDGYYSLATLNEALLSAMTINGHCLESVNGQSNVYFLQLRSNPTTYSIEFLYNSLAEYYDDGSTASGPLPYTTYFNAPTGWKPPPTYEIPQVFIGNEAFGKLLGFPYGTVAIQGPDSSTLLAQQYSVGSQFTPQMEPSSNFFITSNLVSNSLGIPNNLIDSFCIPNAVSFGDMMSPLGDQVVYSKAKAGVYHSVTIEIFDQSFNALQILDPNILIILSILH